MSIRFILALISGIVILVIVYYPARHAKHYEFVNIEDIHKELVSKYENDASSNLKNCSYRQIISNNFEIPISQVFTHDNYKSPRFGGEFIPECNVLLESAIIVPYRDRKDQLNIFLSYMHNFLQKQNIHYRIFIVEQSDTLPFNRAKMLNYGAKVAMDMNYDCLILHDVDLIPINTGNIYACSRRPRHMSCSLDTFRYNLPYVTLFGGAVAIQAKHFKIVNGMSNLYYGWGAEDDDLYNRLVAHDLMPYRFSPTISRYIMLLHKKVQPSVDRFMKLETSVDRHTNDGLNTLKNDFDVYLEDLYTHIVVSQKDLTGSFL